MTMLEKMAEAMNARAGATEYGPVIPAHLLVPIARAALEAIREPSEALLDIGRDGINFDERVSDDYGRRDLEGALNRMIDAILAGQA